MRSLMAVFLTISVVAGNLTFSGQASARVAMPNFFDNDIPAAIRVTPPANAPQSQFPYDEFLRENGIEPGSEKGRILVSWVEKIKSDPIITGHIQSASGLFLDPRSRAALMSDGLARLARSDRFRYITLITKFLDTLVPADCFGVSDMSEVMNHVVLGNMSESDLTEYLRILFIAFRSAALKTPFDVPTEPQRAAAELALSGTLVSELEYNEAKMSRYQAYAERPEGASPADACWAMRVTMHAMLAMPEPERDVIFRYTVMPQATQSPPAFVPSR